MRGQRHAPAAPYPRERPGTHCTGGWVGLRAGLDRCGKSCPTRIRSPDRPARRQSLYRLRYPAHLCPMFYAKLKEPCSFSKVPDGPYSYFPDILRVQNEGCVCLSEAKTSHSHKMWTEVSSSVPHFLQVGLLLSPIIQGVTGGTDQTSGECSLC